ncbi:unnamed protein product, partial [Brachionus calyciflorus]
LAVSINSQNPKRTVKCHSCSPCSESTHPNVQDKIQKSSLIQCNGYCTYYELPLDGYRIVNKQCMDECDLLSIKDVDKHHCCLYDECNFQRLFNKCQVCDSCPGSTNGYDQPILEDCSKQCITRVSNKSGIVKIKKECNWPCPKNDKDVKCCKGELCNYDDYSAYFKKSTGIVVQNANNGIHCYTCDNCPGSLLEPTIAELQPCKGYCYRTEEKLGFTIRIKKGCLETCESAENNYIKHQCCNTDKCNGQASSDANLKMITPYPNN